MIKVKSSKYNLICISFIISMINQDINNADWATYAVERKFKLLRNSVFPASDNNFFVESSANSVTLSKQVSLKKVKFRKNDYIKVLQVYLFTCALDNLIYFTLILLSKHTLQQKLYD